MQLKNTKTLNHEPYTLKTSIRSDIFKKKRVYFVIIDSINEVAVLQSSLGDNHKTWFSISPNPSI